MGRIDQNWPPGGEAMARAIFTRTLAYCNGFELQGRKTFTRHLEAAIGSARQGYFQETVIRMRQAISEAQARFGAQHPVLAAILVLAADADLRHHDGVEAEAKLRGAASILEGMVGHENLLAYVYACLGVLYQNQGIGAEAQRYFARAQQVSGSRPAETGSA